MRPADARHPPAFRPSAGNSPDIRPETTRDYAANPQGAPFRGLLPIPLRPLRPAVGGVVVILLTLLVGTRAYNGGGMDVIERIFEEGVVRPEAFLLKMIFTSITIGAGFKGGEIVPTLFIGATLGGTLALLVGLSPAFGAAIGIAALFCGVTNCPIATILLSVELFGGESALFCMIAALVSFLFSGYFSLYSGQQLIYSKLSEKEINVHGH